MAKTEDEDNTSIFDELAELKFQETYLFCKDYQICSFVKIHLFSSITNVVKRISITFIIIIRNISQGGVEIPSKPQSFY